MWLFDYPIRISRLLMKSCHWLLRIICNLMYLKKNTDCTMCDQWRLVCKSGKKTALNSSVSQILVTANRNVTNSDGNHEVQFRPVLLRGNSYSPAVFRLNNKISYCNLITLKLKIYCLNIKYIIVYHIQSCCLVPVGYIRFKLRTVIKIKNLSFKLRPYVKRKTTHFWTE